MSVTQGPHCHSFGIRGFGDPAYGVVIVGIAPGRDEIEKSKRPFTGPSGQLMDSLMQFADWERDKVYATNAVCWFQNKPSEDELAACRERFHRELEWAKPKLIITAGEIAYAAVSGFKRRKGSRGAVNWSRRWGCYILDTHHPSAVLQTQSMSFAQDIIRDFAKIERILSWGPNAEVALVEHSCVESLKEGQALLNSLPKDGRNVTLDIETSSLDAEIIDAFSDQLITFSVSYNDDDGREINTVFPTRILNSCVRNGQHAKYLREGKLCGAVGCPHPDRQALVFPTDGIQWTFQSAPGDVLGIFHAFGVVLPVKDDTLLMSYCGDERPGYHGLKANAREYFAAGWYEDRVKPFYKGKMDKLPPPEIEEYNAKDSAYDLRLVPIKRQGMEDSGTEALYRDLLLPASETLIDAQLRGIYVERDLLNELAMEWFQRWVDTYQSLQQEAHSIGWPTDDINFNSNDQLRKLFFGIMSLDPTKFSKKTGRPSLDKEVLGLMDHPFAAKLRAFRMLDDMVNYVLELFANMKSDGLVHPTGFVTTTRTGRTSYRGPATQKWPKDYTVGADYARIREVIRARFDTHEIMEADYTQIEVYLAQFHSKDEVLLQHLQSGDVHSATAEGAFNIKRDAFTKDAWGVYRQNAKKIRFGLAYGEGAEGLSRPPPVGIGGTKAAAQRFVDNFWKTYPQHRRWNQDTQRRIMEDGYIRSASGRVMRFPLVLDHKALRQAINFPIQADASDYCLSSMVEIGHPDTKLREFSRRLRALNSWFLLNNHDALVMETDKRYRREVADLLREVMERVPFEGYPSLKVEIKVGDSLGTVKEWRQ